MGQYRGRTRRPLGGLYGTLLVGLVSASGCSLKLAAPDAAQRGVHQPSTYQSNAHQPESASGLVSKPGWVYQRQAVAAAHTLAAEAGQAILRAGGAAVDAAIAVQMVLGLVEPQSSGIGGGAFLI
ncbi:MAG: hypothetical protein RLZZ344_1629, partial [Pseudomonadota bacterium]